MWILISITCRYIGLCEIAPIWLSVYLRILFCHLCDGFCYSRGYVSYADSGAGYHHCECCLAAHAGCIWDNAGPDYLGANQLSGCISHFYASDWLLHRSLGPKKISIDQYRWLCICIHFVRDSRQSDFNGVISHPAGVFGAALVPLSQSIMVSIFPEEERGSAMAIWGIGVMVGPILGPTLGGYLTEIASCAGIFISMFRLVWSAFYCQRKWCRIHQKKNGRWIGLG